MKFVIMFRILAIIVILAVAIDGENFQIAKPGCSDRCGNVSIPYPFGTTEGSYLNDDFFINCVNQTTPFLWGSDLEITNISLSGGQLTVMQCIARYCYQNGTRDSKSAWIKISKFTVSNAANKFFVVGCDTYGFVTGQRLGGRGYMTSCASSCVDKDDVENGTCTGLGCCMTSIPNNVRRVNTKLGSFDNYRNVSTFDNCGYAFVVQESNFTFSLEKITSLRNVEMLPMVLDWAIGDGNCTEAEKANSSNSYACKSVNSECWDPENGPGYRCNCTQGYRGNPYLDDGCRGMIIGEGGYGTIYKGFLHGDDVVAIKKAKEVPKQIDQFTNEMIVLSQIKHKNVVKLLGCCLETEFPLLVYEFIGNGTLSQHVHNKTRARLLSWEMRLRIAQDVASVLSYLHSDATSTPIIHRDVKCANILLDHSFTAKVADFGASRLVPLDPSQLSTMVQGTFGYLDPEYLQTNQLNEKSDVYSFGVVLVELLTGMTALSYDRPEEERNLANLFVMKQNCLFEILEENVLREGNEEDVRKVCVLARSCLNVRGEDRPSMKEVAMDLEGVRVGGKKHSWNRTDFVDEDKETLLDKRFDGIINDGGNSSSVVIDSLMDNMILPLDGGR